MIEDIAKKIQDVINGKSYRELRLIGLSEFSMPDDLVGRLNFDYFELEINSGKRYTVKLFNLAHYYELPPGLSTAYLNCRTDFECFGFIGAVNTSANDFRYIFLSIEENPIFYLSRDRSFNAFRSNEIQMFYFVSYFLKFLSYLNLYKLQLLYTPIFAVDSSDSKKWRFRVEDIKMFELYALGKVYLNHDYLISIINRFLTLMTNQTLKNVFNNVKNVAVNLKNYNDKEYFSILINMVEHELNNFIR